MIKKKTKQINTCSNIHLIQLLMCLFPPWRRLYLDPARPRPSRKPCPCWREMKRRCGLLFRATRQQRQRLLSSSVSLKAITSHSSVHLRPSYTVLQHGRAKRRQFSVAAWCRPAVRSVKSPSHRHF